jgi:hypothetical protein
MDNLVGEPTSSAKGMRLGSGTLVTRPGKLTVCELENHHFFMGKSPFFYGKINIFNGKITIFNGKINNFYGPFSIAMLVITLMGKTAINGPAIQ